MKIAFIGTHGTGKTTLAHELVTKLKKKGYDSGFLGEVARQCPFPINEETTKKAQIWIILNQIIKEIEAEERCGFLVSDRSVLDGYVYYVKKFGRAQFLEPIIKKHLQTYDYIIKVPIREGFLTKDKVRSTNEIFQKEIDKEFEKQLKFFKVDYMSLDVKKQEDDKEAIKSLLESLN